MEIDAKQREKYGKVASIVGILANIVLAGAKIVVGLVFGVLSLTADGFNNLSEEPVVTDEIHPYAILPEHFPRIFEEYDRLAQKIIELKKRGEAICFFHFMIDLDQGPCAIRRLRGCSCGNEYIAVTPSGQIFPCHNFVGQDEWLRGSVHDGSFDEGMKRRFRRSSPLRFANMRRFWTILANVNRRMRIAI